MSDNTGFLRFFCGPMAAGKSTLALQYAYNHQRAGRTVLMLCQLDRSGPGKITSRLGLVGEGVEIDDTTSITGILDGVQAGTAVVVDEAQFLTPAQVDELALFCDYRALRVDAFGLMTDFRSRMFPGAQRLCELADEIRPLPLDVYCWCGRQGRMNTRVQHGNVVRDGETVVVGDVDDGDDVTYQVLCRHHWRHGQLRYETSDPVGRTLSGYRCHDCWQTAHVKADIIHTDGCSISCQINDCPVHG